MSKNTSITINTIEKFDEIKTKVEASIPKTINGRSATEKIEISNFNYKIEDYKKYKMIYDDFHTKTKPIYVNGEWSNEYLEKNEFYGYKKNENYFFTISDLSYKTVQSAIKILKNNTKIKCTPLNISLVKLVESIIKKSEIEIRAGWFGELGLPNLDSVLLKGDDVNESDDWKKFKSTPGAKITTLEIIFIEGDFEGFKVTVSSKGFIFLKGKQLTEEESLKLAEIIVELIK
ncbi:MAG: hypothetical protein ACRC0F_10450 [Cetobacterium sp.]